MIFGKWLLFSMQVYFSISLNLGSLNLSFTKIWAFCLLLYQYFRCSLFQMVLNAPVWRSCFGFLPQYRTVSSKVQTSSCHQRLKTLLCLSQLVSLASFYPYQVWLDHLGQRLQAFNVYVAFGSLLYPTQIIVFLPLMQVSYFVSAGMLARLVFVIVLQDL